MRVDFKRLFKKESGNKRADIQAMRALSILAVLIYHLWPNKLTGGFTGVDVFFVISGFLMTGTIVRHMSPILDKESKKIKETVKFLVDFYARRIRRLLPASFATITVVLLSLVIVFAGEFALQIKTATQAITSILLMQNWQLARTSVDYLAQSEAPTALQHFWTLSVEEQFYLFWPLLLVIISAISLKFFNKKTIKRILPIFMGIFTVASLIHGYRLTEINQAAAYFVTWGRLWELSLGGILVFLPKIKRQWPGLISPWVGFILVICSFIFINPEVTPFPGIIALLPTVGAALIVLGNSDTKFSFGNLARFKPVQLIGDSSYSLYLWHWPLIVLMPLALRFDLQDGRHELHKIVIAIVAFVMSWLSYIYIENLSQKILRNWTKKKLFIVFGVFAIVLVSSAVGVRIYNQKVSERGSAMLRNMGADDSNKCFGARSIVNVDECGESLGKVSEDKEMIKFGAVDSYDITSDGKTCKYDVNSTKLVKMKCIYGDTSSKKTILLFGDSHAQSYSNAIDYIGKKYNFKVFHMAMVNCHTYKKGDKAKDNCERRLKWVLNDILPNVDMVITSIISQHYMRSGLSMKNILENMLDKAHEHKKQVYLIEDYPCAGYQGGPDCIKNKLSCKETRNDVLVTDQFINSLKKDGYYPSRNYNFVATNEYFCDKDWCYSYVGGIPVYINAVDKNAHLTGSFSTSLGLGIGEKIFGQ